MYFSDSLQWYGRGKIKFKSRVCFMFTTLRVMGKENTKKKKKLEVELCIHGESY